MTEDEYAPKVHGEWLAGGNASYSMVNLLFPLRIVDTDGNEAAYFGLAHWVLSRVPMIGEEVQTLDHRVKIEGVLWGSDGKVSVRLVEARVRVDALAALEAEGWSVRPWEDEPPSEWFETNA